jgi:hypothetical protein
MGSDGLCVCGIGRLPRVDLVDAEECGSTRQTVEAARAKLSSPGITGSWRMTMTEYRFTLTIDGADVLSDAAQDALHEAGCNDATFGSSQGIHTAEFDREAADFSEAVASAIKAIEVAVPGAKVTDVHREEDVAAPR